MYFYPRKVKYPTDNQLKLWALKRNKLTGREIAEQSNVSPAFVSKTIKEANKRIKAILENSARMNKIKLNLISVELGFARGLSYMFNVQSYITFSPENGVQVWYEHKGDCVKCEEYAACREMLLEEFKERNVKIPNPSTRPTDLGEILFKKLESMIE